MINAIFKPLDTEVYTNPAKQWDYGQILRIQGVTLPKAVEVHFGISGEENTVPSVGVTDGDHTDVEIPDGLLRQPNDLVAYVYIADVEKGNTVKTINIPVIARAKPAIPHTPEDEAVFREAIEAVNTAADRAEKAGQTATEAAGQAAEDAQQTAEDRKEVEKMVETVSDISEQVKKVEQLSQQAQEAATKTEADAQQTAEDRVEVGKMLETVKDVPEQVKTVEESVRKAKESEQAAEGHRTAVEEMKNSVEQTTSGITQVVQTGVQEINSAKQSAVQEVTQTGTAQKTAVEGAGTQAVENVENVKQAATTAVETVKTEAVQAVQTEGTKQTGNVSAEGAKQIKEVQDKGAEVLQSIPENFATQMETKLNKQQGIENKGKALVIGEDGNVVPEEVASGGGDGIAIINTMSGESPLVIPDSAERVNKGLELGGKTEQVQTTGKNLFDPNNNYEDLVWIGNDGEIVGGSNARTSDYIPVEQGNYAFQFDVINYNQMFVAGYNTGKQFVKIVGTISKGKCIIKIDDIQIETIRLSYTRESTRIQLERSETQTPYEPYTGGKPSPSPEYPQEIKNVGKWNEETQKYDVDVKITGKNLLNTYEKAEKDSEFYSVNGDGSLNQKKVDNRSFLTVPETLFLRAGKYYFSIFDTGVTFQLYNADANKVLLVIEKQESVLVDLEKDTNIKYKVFNSSGTANNVRVMVSINKETDYVPCKEPQTLTLTSDRPITKWDRLVEQGGQIGWLYAGVVIDRFDGQSNKISIANKQGNVQNFSIRFENVANGNGNSDIFVDKYRAVQLSYTKAEYGICCNWNDGVKYFSAPNENVATVDDFKAWLIENPLKIAYETTNPEFVPLPQSEQNAIRALKTYYPTTVITVDGGELDPDIKVTYTADTKLYIDNKVSANVASIISQYQLNTANLLSLMPMETQAAMIESDTNNILENAEEMKHE